MHTREFMHKLDNDRVVKAIGAAEMMTSGEIRVFISKKKHIDDPVLVAEAEFHRLKMDQTALRNGVLIFLAPEAQAFAIIGDKAIHEKCGQEFWTHVAEAMRECFVKGDYTEGLVRVIEAAGHALKEHFPRSEDDVNELPDHIEHES